MAQSTSFPVHEPALAKAAPRPASGLVSRAAPLASWPIGEPGRVREVRVEGRDGAFIRAVALVEGEIVTVLRRAGFGGPLHVRVESGAEFAIDRELARAVTIDPIVEGDARAPEPALRDTGS